MKDLYKMTKEELVAKCRKLQSENERLKDELDGLSDCYAELESQLASETELDDTNCIFNLSYFKSRLVIDNVMTPQLEDFIENYLRFYNRKE